jgi:hypothetical protein
MVKTALHRNESSSHFSSSPCFVFWTLVFSECWAPASSDVAFVFYDVAPFVILACCRQVYFVFKFIFDFATGWFLIAAFNVYLQTLQDLGALNVLTPGLFDFSALVLGGLLSFRF